MGRPSMSMSAGEGSEGMSSREKNAMLERIGALENLLYQSMEAQVRCECGEMVERQWRVCADV